MWRWVTNAYVLRSARNKSGSSAVRSATDHWEMAKAEDSFADLLERMADELEMGSAHDRGRFLAAAHALRQSAAVNEHWYVTGLSDSCDDP
jgi:hypothetical protein